MTIQEKEEISRLYNEEGMNPEDIAEELDLDEIEVMDYCAEQFFDYDRRKND